MLIYGRVFAFDVRLEGRKNYTYITISMINRYKTLFEIVIENCRKGFNSRDVFSHPFSFPSLVFVLVFALKYAIRKIRCGSSSYRRIKRSWNQMELFWITGKPLDKWETWRNCAKIYEYFMVNLVDVAVQFSSDSTSKIDKWSILKNTLI